MRPLCYNKCSSYGYIPPLNIQVIMSKNAKRFSRKEKVQQGFAPTPIKPKVIELYAQTYNQKVYEEALKRDPLIFVVGCAGTGKTYMAATMAAKMYNERLIKRIVITRPNISAGKGLGFFPGTLEEKMAPWIMPIMQVLVKHLGPQRVDAMKKDGSLVVEPFETMRGRTFDNSFVLLDEAQNTTYEELKMFLTRIGKNTKVVVNGDVQQTDLKHNSGLHVIIHVTKSQLLKFPIIEMTEEDIVRSDICATWIKAFMKYERTVC